jgi:hypothetical protein
MLIAHKCSFGKYSQTATISESISDAIGWRDAKTTNNCLNFFSLKYSQILPEQHDSGIRYLRSDRVNFERSVAEGHEKRL